MSFARVRFSAAIYQINYTSKDVRAIFRIRLELRFLLTQLALISGHELRIREL